MGASLLARLMAQQSNQHHTVFEFAKGASKSDPLADHIVRLRYRIGNSPMRREGIAGQSRQRLIAQVDDEIHFRSAVAEELAKASRLPMLDRQSLRIKHLERARMNLRGRLESTAKDPKAISGKSIQQRMRDDAADRIVLAYE